MTDPEGGVRERTLTVSRRTGRHAALTAPPGVPRPEPRVSGPHTMRAGGAGIRRRAA